MTKLTRGKSVIRETGITVAHLPLVAELLEGSIIIHRKGDREKKYLPYDALWKQAWPMPDRRPKRLAKAKA